MKVLIFLLFRVCNATEIMCCPCAFIRSSSCFHGTGLVEKLPPICLNLGKFWRRIQCGLFNVFKICTDSYLCVKKKLVLLGANRHLQYVKKFDLGLLNEPNS